MPFSLPFLNKANEVAASWALPIQLSSSTESRLSTLTGRSASMSAVSFFKPSIACLRAETWLASEVRTGLSASSNANARKSANSRIDVMFEKKSLVFLSAFTNSRFDAALTATDSRFCRKSPAGKSTRVDKDQGFLDAMPVCGPNVATVFDTS